MRRFLVARAAQTAFVAAFVSTLAFFLIHFAPGDPLAVSPDDPAEVAAARAQMRVVYGLDLPLAQQYPRMVKSFLRGEFGESLAQARPVSEILIKAFPRTLALMAPALLLGVLAGVAIGTLQGIAAGRTRDRLASAVSLALLSLPEFLIALVVSGFFAQRLGWLPATGMTSADLSSAAGFGTVLADYARHAALPVLSLAVVVAALVSRYQRSAVIDVMQEDFVRAIRAKGVARSRVVLRHVLRRTAGTTFAVLGLLFPLLVGGAALVEFVYAWPGAGSGLFRAVLGRDYPVVVAFVLTGSIAVCIGSALADWGAQRANPATRLES